MLARMHAITHTHTHYIDEVHYNICIQVKILDIEMPIQTSKINNQNSVSFFKYANINRIKNS